METITMNVKGMSCGGCVASVTRVLKAVPGVDNVNVTLDPGAATVSYDPQRTDATKLRGAVEDAGYDVVA
jgi:copper chaperone